MKKISVMLLPLLVGSALFAQDYEDSNTMLRWQRIVGVITAPNVDNPVAQVTDGQGRVLSQISAGTLPWVTTRGSARVNLSRRTIAFDVDGLVLDGGNASGTTGPIVRVTGTLVCNTGTANQVVVDTPAVPISHQGDADFFGNVDGIPSACANPLFFIRIPQFGSRWIATGAVFTATGN
jgi:hypothetical protein